MNILTSAVLPGVRLLPLADPVQAGDVLVVGGWQLLVERVVGTGPYMAELTRNGSVGEPLPAGEPVRVYRGGKLVGPQEETA